MTTLNIRRAAQEDVPTVQRLLHALWLEEHASGYAPDLDLAWPLTAEAARYVSGRVLVEGLALLAFAGSDVAGYLLAGPRSSPLHTAVGLESMFVVSGLRRRGFGLALLSAFTTWRRQSGFSLASVAVAPQNLAAVSLYTRAGFLPTTLILEDRTRPTEA